jgi:hypothetical protein
MDDVLLIVIYISNSESTNDIRSAYPLRSFKILPLILAPYFVNVQHLSIEESFNRIGQWVNECAKVKKLEPSVEYFHALIEYSIERARVTGFKPLKLKETLRDKNKQLYEILT